MRTKLNIRRRGVGRVSTGRCRPKIKRIAQPSAFMHIRALSSCDNDLEKNVNNNED